MGLSNDVLKDFAGLINDRNDESKSVKTTTAYGMAVVSDGIKYVQLDGSDYLTPIAEATEAKDGDRVMIEIKEHRAVVIGNFTAPPSLQKAEDALDKAGEALENLEDAKGAAEEAKKDAEEASKKAQEAINKAGESQTASQEAQRLIGEANQEIEKLREEIKDVEVDTDKVRDIVKNELPPILEETVSAEYAKKTDLVDVKGELEGSISMTAGELKTEMSEHYVTQSELVKIEEYLNTKINQNSEEIILGAYETVELETDTEEIKNLLRTAKEKVRIASEAANEAKDLANAAERDLLRAEGSLTVAQENLAEALEYLNQVTNKDDATQEEIYDAQNRVAEAELAVNKAGQDVIVAQKAADDALADAQAAQEAFEQAKTELSEVVSSVTEMRAQIEVEAEAVRIQVIEKSIRESLEEDYYDKKETESLIETEAGKISLSVTTQVTNNIKDQYVAKDEVGDVIADNVEIGGRNMCLGTSSDWTEFKLGTDYVSIMRFDMTELCEKYELVDGDILTYSIQLKSDSGKRIAAGWQKYNSSTNRISEVSDDTIIASSGRSYVNPIIDTSYKYLDLMVVNLSTNLTSNTTEYYRCLQLEKGNVPTEWSLAQEDTEEAIGSVQDNINQTGVRVDNVDQEMIFLKSQIEVLEGIIKTLITDENGSSLMTQTSTGWTYNISGIQENVSNNGDTIAKLQELMSTLSATTGGLETAVGNLQETSEYIWLTTYEDKPCIALGESDSNYGLFITNTGIIFVDGSGNPTYIDKDGLYTNKLTVETEFRQRNFIWSVRQNGNYGLMWRQSKAESIDVFYSGGEVYVDTPLSKLTGIIVRVNYSDGTIGRTADYTLSGSIKGGNNTITVTYSGLTDTFIVVGIVKPVDGVTLGSATSAILSFTDIPGASDSLIVSYANQISVVNGVASLYNPNNFTLEESIPTNPASVYGVVYGKYLKVNNDIYYVDPAATYSRYTESGTLTSTIKLKYEPAYLVMVNGSGSSGGGTEVTLSSISVNYSGGQVPVGTSINTLKSSLTVTATYSDGSTSRITDYTLSGTINAGSNSITVSYGGKTARFTVTGYTQDTSGLIMKTGTIKDNTSINTGLKSISQLVLYRTSIASTGLIDACYNINTTNRFTYCSTAGSYGLNSGGISSFTPTVNGGTFVWPHTTASMGLATGVEYIWIAYGES